MKERVLVALSGGIDSAVAGLLLKKAGYDVLGVHFRFFEGRDPSADDRLKLIADRLQIDISVSDVRIDFQQQVLDPVLRLHREGKTPSPCTICNPRVKWSSLAKLAGHCACARYATGHYFRIERLNNMTRILKGTDPLKDQSYYVWGIPENILRHGLTPLGGMTKVEVREIAVSAGLSGLLHSGESMGLCFTDHSDYSDYLKAKLTDPGIGEGKVFDRQGNFAGTHQGYPFYTVGQKKNLLLKEKYSKWCVAAIRPADNVLIIDEWQHLFVHEFLIEDAYFFDEEEISGNSPIQVKVRGFGLNPGKNCRLIAQDSGRFLVVLDEPAWAVAGGQPAVFYSGDLVLGGGSIVPVSGSILPAG